MLNQFKKFIQIESAGGITLLSASLLAVILSNSPLSNIYHRFIELPIAIRVGSTQMDKPLLLWINDGLMAIFFLLIGLELKREILQGELSDFRKIALPAIGALGGMICPMLIYSLFNWNNPIAMRGWAISSATDIAFSIGILSLLGRQVPLSLKVFLVSLAIFDDIGAIIIIALFYTHELSWIALLLAFVCMFCLFFLNRRNVNRLSPYLIVGIVMWVAVLKSGVHATLAGFILSLFIPDTVPKYPGLSSLRQLENRLHSTVTFRILPLFAFVNSGISFSSFGINNFLHPVPLGIASGLFFGKQIGVFLSCLAGIKLGIAKLPRDASWFMLYGVSQLCGVGFTMSLFIGSLAFGEARERIFFDERTGIVAGSIISGIAGFFLLKRSLKRHKLKTVSDLNHN